MAIKFLPLKSSIEPGFWEILYEKKLNFLKLLSERLKLTVNFDYGDGSCRFAAASFQSSEPNASPARELNIRGSVLNVNTIEEYKNCDKKQFIDEVANGIREHILLGSAIRSPNDLFTFGLLVFADLKSYRFTYWFCQPVLLPTIPFRSVYPAVKLCDANRGLLTALYRGMATFYNKSHGAIVFTAMKSMTGTECGSEKEEWSLHTLEEGWASRFDSASTHIIILDFVAPLSSGSSAAVSDRAYSWNMRNLLALIAIRQYESCGEGGGRGTFPGEGDGASKNCSIVALRGALLARVVRRALESLSSAHTQKLSPKSGSETKMFAAGNVLDNFLRAMSDDDIASADDSSTFMFDCTLDYFPVSRPSSTVTSSGMASERVDDQRVDGIKVVGWEPNERGKPGPRVADLSAMLDNAQLMSRAVDLNIRLMKWRLWPALDEKKVADARCLLFGAGTLGCSVARSLLAWGVRHITLVDNGRVSYSNPARQCLFEASDCASRAYKAVAAAGALRRIFPGVNARGVVMTVPMPGHANTAAPSDVIISDSSAVGEQGQTTFSVDPVAFADELVQTHDVCFTLTDSREARWLPTLLCATYDKLLLNAALGFDSFLVMRHGHGLSPQSHDGISSSSLPSLKPPSLSPFPPIPPTISSCPLSSSHAAEETQSLPRLGCYFCSDIVAAVNSQKDRTLDQQCTVTRPGLSFIASALAVELMVSVLQSPLGSKHPAAASPLSPTNANGDMREQRDGDEEIERLEPIPHQIRGTLAGFTQMLPMTPAFSCCTACSPAIVREYRRSVLSVKERSSPPRDKDLEGEALSKRDGEEEIGGGTKEEKERERGTMTAAVGSAFVRAVCEDASGAMLESLSGVSALTSGANLDLCEYHDDDDDF